MRDTRTTSPKLTPMATFYAALITLALLVLSGCAAQQATDRYNASLAIDKQYDDIAQETRINPDATDFSLKNLANPAPFRLPMYGKLIAEQRLGDNSIYKHVDKMKSTSSSYVGGLIGNDTERFIIYYFLADKDGKVIDWATGTYEASSDWSLNPFGFDFDISKKTEQQIKGIAELDELVITSTEEKVSSWM
ncbi:hypothetical protein L1D31_22090 [Vibrio sp. Isolate23]|uniref:hypothetical protein n=1 Tax=Vibrio sp. Isolate23 TaxID=2908533 RepID=UPI001EFD3AD9|nr:hypothetical protein [Vibrio sp. Isolate23]MCG9685211.1 hypothetical protein [Vibrio sp. Isolate23]